MSDISADTISLRGAGIVSITQPKKGHRFTLDSILLADFCRISPRDNILEPGAGAGVVSILLAKKCPRVRLTAVELEPHAYGLLKQNIERNGLHDRIVPALQDIKSLNRSVLPEAFDVIVANPPYVQFGTGRKSPSVERQTARQDQYASLAAWLNLQSLLKNKGRYVLVFPASRAAELISLMRDRKLEPKRIRFVHSRLDKPASLFLMDAVKGGRPGIEILPPLIVHEQGGGYSDGMKEIYGLQDPERRKR